MAPESIGGATAALDALLLFDCSSHWPSIRRLVASDSFTSTPLPAGRAVLQALQSGWTIEFLSVHLWHAQNSPFFSVISSTLQMLRSFEPPQATHASAALELTSVHFRQDHSFSKRNKLTGAGRFAYSSRNGSFACGCWTTLVVGALLFTASLASLFFRFASLLITARTLIVALSLHRAEDVVDGTTISPPVRLVIVVMLWPLPGPGQSPPVPPSFGARAGFAGSRRQQQQHAWAAVSPSKLN
uniref:Uncharacterized protein n=1 Tax=Anopheles merus TaxID=30066 RepID=A0A182VLC7_ANOME